MRSQSTKELSNVLSSLEKLAELEKRISSLEQDNGYVDLQRNAPDTAPQPRTKLEFKKSRVADKTSGTMSVAYTLRPKKTAWASKTEKVVGPKKLFNSAKNTSGVFLTEGGSDAEASLLKYGLILHCHSLTNLFLLLYRTKEDLRRERQRQLALASSGQKNLRSRINQKKLRAKETSAGAKRHEEAMNEIIKRRHEMMRRPDAKAKTVHVTKGASAGIKTKNKHLQEFEQMKAGFQKKKGMCCACFVDFD